MSPTHVNRLARICAYSREAPEWEEFVRLVTPVVALAARRVSEVWGDDSPNTVTEIVQDVFLKLCENDRRILREYQDRGTDSFVKLLRLVTASVATDHFRRTQADKRGGRSTQTPVERRHLAGELRERGLRAAEALQRPALIAQLDGLLRLFPDRVSVRDRNMFWLYYRQGMTAAAIAGIPAFGLTEKGVESSLKRLRLLLKETIASGKPIRRPQTRKSINFSKPKGISTVIAIDSMKER